MAATESRPGNIERGANILRDVSLIVGGIALFFGRFGKAAIAAISAVVSHASAKYLKSRREG